MARGKRTSLSSLVESVGDRSPVDRLEAQRSSPSSIDLSELVANPRNPRDDIGTLDDLASIAETQLQPVLVVSRYAYLRLYPEDEPQVGDANWVVINGCRRYAAAGEYGREKLDVVVKDEVAKDRATLLSASVTENVGRQDFDVLEEAKAVELLVQECGSAGAAARRLKKTEGWVSQRRSLLKLAPELQAALRRGELAVRSARSLARVPLAEQVKAWEVDQNPGETDSRSTRKRQSGGGGAASVVRSLRRLKAKPDVLAGALREYLGEEGLRELLDELKREL